MDNSSSNSSTGSYTTEKSSESKAGSSPLETTRSSEIMGVAVFRGDKLVGELSAQETLCYLILKNKIRNYNITLPNPENEDSSIDLFAYNSSSPKIKVRIVNGTPFIDVDIKLEAKFLSINDQSDYMSQEKLDEITQSANQYIKNMFSKFLYKTSAELQSDINGFGSYSLSLFSTTQEFEQYNWLNNYKNTFFNINVDTQIQSSFLLNGKQKEKN